MKKLNLVTVAVLASTMVGGVVASAANTAPDKLDTNAHIKFVQDDNNGEGGGEVEPPELPEGGGEIEVPTPGGNQPSEKAPLMINFAPNFEFGEVAIKAKDVSVSAINQIKNKEGKDVAHFAQVLDNRGTHKGWNLSLTTTEFAAKDGSKLSDATISLANVTAKGTSEGQATAEASQTIKFPQTDVSVMTAAEKTGEGSWTASFGSDATLTTENEKSVNKSVKLNVSAKDMAKVSADDYNSTLTWNLTGTPTFAASATPAV
ncbi:WxL domain-containing protein [Vagococcus sp. PNs007]|uniref:WxL domain-containing protein n=1 Tax=Vagococcus proximus TaxID=2991417 RepID=A0ABT5WZX0_9ENTE|nr:WxL domain-containing protein [Vagococcus proximus]MDF0479202.1 WxL domain-containing protein [Vagococcus proximus]